MRQLGLLFMIFGIGSSVLYFMGREFTLLQWIENWGPNAAWGIRAGIAVVGLLMFMAAKKKPK